MVLMINRFRKVLVHAFRQPGFLTVFIAGLFLILLGTMTYSLNQHWSIIDAFYFSVATLTTTGVADPHLTITSEPLKLFTALYVLIGIGVLVELIHQLGLSYVDITRESAKKRKARKRDYNS